MAGDRGRRGSNPDDERWAPRDEPRWSPPDEQQWAPLDSTARPAPPPYTPPRSSQPGDAWSPPPPGPHGGPGAPAGPGAAAPWADWAMATPPPVAALPKAGNARTGPLPLHPMSVSDVIDGAFKLLKANARTIAVIVLVFTGPIHILTAFAQRNFFGGEGLLTVFNDPSLLETAAEDEVGAETWIPLIASGVNLLLLPFIAGAISRVVAASYLGEELSAGPALRAALRRSWALIASWFLVHLLEFPAFLLCILPGLAVMTLSIAVAPAIVVEEIGPLKAIRRSWQLMRKRFWPVMGIALLSGLVTNVIGSTLGTVPNVVALFIGLEWGWILVAVAAVVTALVTTPIAAIVATLVYFDARIRNEGFDLQVIASGLHR